MTTPILELDEIVESQASKYITHNGALRAIEALTIRVLDIRTSAPPGSPADGDAYICGSGSISGDWAAFTINDIAYYNSGWYNLTPSEGLRVWVNDEDALYCYYGSAWTSLIAGGASHARQHDIDATADHNGVSGATENNLVSFNSNGLPKDSGVDPEDVVKRLASVTAAMQNGDGKTDLYTVPASKKFIPTHVVIRNPTASLVGGTDYDIGDGAGADTWKTTIDLSGMTATTDCMVITNDNAKFTVYDAADVFGIIPVTGATADAEATVDVFGYLYDA